MVKNYKAFVRQQRRSYKPDAVCVWADWNLNLNLAWVRDWIKGAWRFAKALGRRKTPKQGTHGGGRVIDNAFPRHATRGPRTRVDDHGTIEPHERAA